MLLDKKKVGYVTKVGAVIIALTFIVSYIPFINSVINPDTQQNNSQVDMTITALEQAVKKSPKDADAWIKLGNAYHDLNMWDKATTSYEQALQLDPKNVNARVDMSIDYYEWGQIETATAQAKKATEIDPKHAPAHYNLGVFLVSLGKNEEALKAYKKYIELAPTGDKVNEAKAQVKVIKKSLKSTTTTESDLSIETEETENNVTVVTEKSPTTTIKK